MKKLFILLLLIVLTCLVKLNGCNSEPLSPQENLSFSNDILPVFAANCSFPGCHNSVDKPFGIDLSSWNSIMLHGSIYGSEIIPYNSRWSHLIQHINYDTNIAPVSTPHMPKPHPPYTNGNPLPANITQMIMKWIDEGAKKDNGETAFSFIPHKAFITNQASDFVAVVNTDNYFVTKYDAYSYEKLGRLYAVTSPGHVIIMQDGLKGYVTNYSLSFSERFIKSFNTQTMTVINTISDITMNATHGGRITNDGQYLIIVSELGEFIQIIRTSDDYVEQTIPVDVSVPPNGNGTGNFRPIAVSISPDDRYAFVTCDKSNDLRVLDLNTRTITAVIPVGIFPIQSECSPDGNWVYVANRNSNSVTVINVSSLSVYKTIPGVGAQPHGVAFTPDGRYAYVTCESVNGTFVHHPLTGSYRPGTTAVIDLFNNHVKIKDIEMASYPAGISITRQ